MINLNTPNLPLLRNLMINGLFLSDRIYWICRIFLSFFHFPPPRPPRLSHRDPPAMRLNWRFLLMIGGGILYSGIAIRLLTGIAGRTKGQQKSCKSLAKTWVSNNEYKELTYEIL